MPVLLGCLALITPRLVIVLVYLFSNWFSGLFASVLWPILGFLFLPTTLLWYTAVQHWFGGQWTIVPIIGIVIALAMDVSPAGSRKRRTADD
jgi:hypothetical protein